MPQNNFLLFDENKGNMLADAAYQASAQRLDGVQTGIASSQLNNKFSYQVSLIAYAIAQIMNANGKDATDELAVTTFVSNLSNSLVQKVADAANQAMMIAGTATDKFVTPAMVKYALSQGSLFGEKVIKYAQLDNELRYLCVGKNLLRNWYFVGGGSQQGGGQFPINSRGQTEYSGVGYTIDRWGKWGSAGVLALSAGGFEFRNGRFDFVQPIEKSLLIPGTYTFSAIGSIQAYNYVTLYNSDAKDAIFTKNISNGLIFGTVTLTEEWVSKIKSSNSDVSFVLIGQAGSYDGTWMTLKAIKLELGSQQTLAHQDESGNWVLNELPNYEEELIKCITSKADTSDTYANKVLATVDQVDTTGANARAYAKALGLKIVATATGSYNEQFSQAQHKTYSFPFNKTLSKRPRFVLVELSPYSAGTTLGNNRIEDRNGLVTLLLFTRDNGNTFDCIAAGWEQNRINVSGVSLLSKSFGITILYNVGVQTVTSTGYIDNHVIQNAGTNDPQINGGSFPDWQGFGGHAIATVNAENNSWQAGGFRFDASHLEMIVSRISTGSGYNAFSLVAYALENEEVG